MKRILFALAASTAIGTGVPAIAQDTSGTSGATDIYAGRPYSPYADRAFPTEVYFGDTHVHTGLSPDAGGSGTRLMPRDAYRFARGEQVTSNTGQPVKLARPFDFYMITDHSDAMGAIIDILKGAPNIMAVPEGKQFHEDFNAGGQTAADAMFRLIGEFSQGTLSPELNYQPGNPAFKRVWDDIVQAAEEFNDPGKFTTFIAFEWTSLVSGNNLHRNVIFRDGPERAGQVVPYTTTPPVGSRNPRDLWTWMQGYEDKTGGDVLAIPHNGNLSNGMMFAMQDDFDNGAALDADYAEQRQKWERLYEATQNKGDGEAHPLLSPEDEFADFETWDVGNLDLSELKTPEMLPGEYTRSGLKRGLQLEAELGVNPFKFGLVGASDNHIGLTTPENDNFFHKFTTYEPSPHRIIEEDGAIHMSNTTADGSAGIASWQYITSGLTAVWAEQNSRGALFDAMERRETYATTGPRMRVRFFGGWDFAEGDVLRRDLAGIGYSKGVPMGADLAAAPEGATAPAFLLYALRDPVGANLDRLQIVKGWLDETGAPQEQVYDVAWSDNREPDADGKLPPVGDTVDLSIPTWTNTIGAAELAAVWQDPDFDPSQRAFYYGRVIEIPTPRWTAYDAVKFELDLPDSIPLTAQERAYTSPIWYTPVE
ncbi:DUF3604 domain-containing protein [Sulfitobacter sp. D35]|uniref:DUF3604 domain-containing protein n=1 Tax=Sulfitobacter sp. D35 TaxID=3083252 RepID=UPI00296EB39A|nr:DUF3604 domain-containing protein [Sulfitobacter sp. D35]MDW4500057.1 DUF3604 domain-containing protein [Sulfitobacter sp. D35]